MNVIDKLVVALGLDPSDFLKGKRDAEAAQKGLRDTSLDAANKVEGANARAAESVAALGRRFLGLYALLTAGKGIKEFVADVTSADAALGRTAKNLDMSGRNLSAWQNAATVAGGSAEGITGTLRGLTSEMQKAALTGQSGIIPVFRALGINLADAQGKARDAGDVLVDLNRKAQGMDPARFTALAHMAGIDDGTIALLEKSTAEFDKLRAEETKYAATAGDIDAAQKRQSGWRQLLITSQSLGRTILTSLTPAITGAMQAVQKWTDANQEWIKTEIVTLVERFSSYLKGLDWAKIGQDVQAFAGNVRDIASAVADAVKGIDGNSLLYKGLEALAVLAGVRLVGAFTGLASTIGGLGRLTLPSWLSGLLLNPAVLGTAAVGAVLASGDPNKAVLSGGHPDLGPRDNDLGLPGLEHEDLPENKTPSDPSRVGGVWDWIKRNAMPDFGKAAEQLKAFGKATGFGDKLHDDPKTKDDISDTAKATGEMRDILKAQKDGLGSGQTFSGVAASSGGVGGSGHHFSGTSEPGANVGDRARGRRGGGGGGAGPADANLPVGNAPGASGYGLINAYWKGPLDKRGEGGHTGPKEMFDYLKSQGATDNEALLLTGSAASESSFNPNAVHDNGTGHGLFGHKDTRLDMRGKNWQQQSLLALAEVRRTLGNRVNAARTPEELTDIEMHNERPRGYKPNNPRGGDNYMGRLNSIRRFSALAGSSAMAPAPAGTSAKAIGDAEVFAARQRIISGSRDPKDRELVERYKQQQNTPKPVTYEHLGRHLLKALSDARRLTRHDNDNKPVSVMPVDKNGQPLAHASTGRAHQRAASLAGMTRMADAGRYRSSTVNHSVHHETRIGEMNVHTKATDGRQFAGEFRDRFGPRGDVVQANGALA